MLYQKFWKYVFAVSPMNPIGQNVFPIAKNFRDLLSLFPSCCHTASIEQMWMFDKELFNRFICDNQPNDEQKAVIEKL